MSVVAGAGTAEAALAFEAPYLVEKLVQEGVAATPEEAEGLFREVKRYVVLATADRSRVYEMHSLLVDQAWHQFVLYTAQYARYCEDHFGHYVHHSPSNAPEVQVASPRPVATFAEFGERYAELFDEPLPDAWYDERNVTPDRKVTSAVAGRSSLRPRGDVVDLVAATGEVLMSITAFAGEALAFAARTPTFFVRELPGGLTDEEKVGLAAAMVEHRLLRIGG